MQTTATPPGVRLFPSVFLAHAPRRESLAPGARSAPRVPRPRRPRTCTPPLRTWTACTTCAPSLTHLPPLLCARPTPSTQSGVPPSQARVGYAVRPSTRQRARRDRLDAHLAPPPPHRPHVLRMCRGALRPATPPYRPTGTESLCTGARTSRSTAPNPLERHDHAAEPRRSTHTPSPCMHVCVYRSAPLLLLFIKTELS